MGGIYINNQLVKSFLKNQEMDILFKSYLKNPIEDKKSLIEEHFRIHVKQIKILSYFSKILNFEAQRFDKKIRNISNKDQLILDNENFNEGVVLIDSFTPQINFQDDEFMSIQSKELENIFEDQRLFTIISNLPNNNKELLYLLFVKEMDEAEIATYLGISKQAVNKRKNSVLKKIKIAYAQD